MDGAVRLYRWLRSRLDILLFLGARLMQDHLHGRQRAVSAAGNASYLISGVRKMDNDRDDRSWAARYRVGATQARQRAAMVQGENTRQVLLSLAAKYDELAAELEERIVPDIAGKELPELSRSVANDKT
jgi:osmotically-inducible protein OsmY